MWLKKAMHTFTDPGDGAREPDNFLLLSPSYKIMQQSSLPPFLRIMDGYGEYLKADQVFKTHWGTYCYFRTGTDPDSIVGITNVRAIWGDEAGMYSLYFWENIQARSSIKQAQVMLTTSPYTLNWLYKEIIRPKNQNPANRPDVELVQARSDENPYFPKAEYEKKKLTMDPRRFNAIYGGQWERMAGLVYDCFDEDENQCEAFTLPAGCKIVGGIDWGYTEPFVLKIRAITPDGRHFGVSETYKSGLIISEIEDLVMQKVRVHGLSLVYCGPDQPAHIEALNRRAHKEKLHCSFIPANNDVRTGIDRHYELLKTRKLKYFKGTHPYTIDELDTYHYPDPGDLKPDDDIKEQKPVAQNDHALDADRYISVMTYASGAKKHVPVAASDGPPKIERDHERRYKQLTRGNKGWRNTENF